RPVNLLEEAERSVRLSGGSARGLLGRVILLDASRGELSDLIKFGENPSLTALQSHEAQPAFLSAEPRSSRTGPSGEAGAPTAAALTPAALPTNGETHP